IRTCSATADPAFSMSVSDGTPKRSLVARSMARISAAVTIFIVIRLSCRRSGLFQLAQLRRLAHRNQAVVHLNPLIGGRIEPHAFAPLDGQHNHSALLPDAGTLQSLARKGR